MNYSLLPLTLMSLHVALFCLAPILGNKIIHLLGFEFVGGTLVMAFAGGVLDVVNNTYGLAMAKKVVVTAMIVRVITWLVILLVVALPGDTLTPGFDKLVRTAFRIFLAGEIAHLVGQYFVDTRLFAWVKEKLPNQGFWLRYNLSNFLSLTVSSIVFVVVAMAGTGRSLTALIVGGLFIRILHSILLTPVFSLLSRWAAKVAIVTAFALLASSANALELGPLELRSTTRGLMSSGAYPARIEEVLFLKWTDANLWMLDIFNWDRSGRDPYNNFNNKMTVAWTPLLGLGPGVQWQTVTGNTPVYRAGAVWRVTEQLWGFTVVNATGLLVATGEKYRYRFDEFITVRYRCGVFVNDIFTWDFGLGTYLLNNKLTFGYEVIPHFALVGQLQTITNQPTVWRWGVQGNL